MMITLAPSPPPARPDTIRTAIENALGTLEGPPDLIVINDPQRGTQTETVLAPLVEQYRFPPPSILVACGSHSFSETEKTVFTSRFSRWFSPDVFLWHDARASNLVPLEGPEPWQAHPALAGARRILAVGSVEPHYFAGLSGAHKTLTIGCAGYADIERNHSHALDPACRPARLDGNPVHAGIVRMLETLAQGRRLAAINLLECEGTVRNAAGGSPLEALEELAPSVGKTWIRTIPAPADGLILEVTGPLAESFYQAEKAIKNSEWAVRNGGSLFLIAPCRKGIGQAAFVRLLTDTRTYADAVQRVQSRGYRLGDHKAVRLRYLTDPTCRGVRLFALAPGLSDQDCRTLGVIPVATLEEGLQKANLLQPEARVYHVRDAAFTCVQISTTERKAS